MRFLRPRDVARHFLVPRHAWQQRFGFAIYHTPQTPQELEWVLEHPVRVTPWMARLRPAFDALRADPGREMARFELADICPGAAPEIDSIFRTFSSYPRNGKVSYPEVCAMMFVASGRQDVLESWFPVLDDDGDGIISREQLASAIRAMYYVRYQDVEYADLKTLQAVNEAMQVNSATQAARPPDTEKPQADAEVPKGETPPTAAPETPTETESEKLQRECLTLEQFTQWLRGGGKHIGELHKLAALPPSSPTISSDKGETWTLPAKMKFAKINVDNPVVEMDGDEMSRILWLLIKQKLIFPFLTMDIDYYDLSVTFRDETDDQVTTGAAKALSKHHVGIKCSTMTPDGDRVLEYNLKKMWKSPTSLLRNAIGGTTFWTPIVLGPAVPGILPHWVKPIVVGRHTEEGSAMELTWDGPGTLKIMFEPNDEGKAKEQAALELSSANGGGVMLGTYNTRESVEKFARCCFEHALHVEMPLYFSSKANILGRFDGLFVDVFNHLYHDKYRKVFEEKGIWFETRLIDDMVAQAMRSSGGFVWACKSYDGDVQSDFVAQGFGGVTLMSSVTMSSDGTTMLVEAAHGSITKHYRAHQKSQVTSTNPLSCIYAWIHGLRHRARLDGNARLAHFSHALEEACVATVQNGHLTRDLAVRVHGDGATEWLQTEEMLNAVARQLRLTLSKPLWDRPFVQTAPFEGQIEGLDRAINRIDS